MEDFDKYKTHLCTIVKDPEFKNKKFSAGFTSEVYRLGDSVIKEVFLNKDVTTTEEAKREINANIFFKENPEFEPYVVKFEGYDICDNRLYMKFEYEDKNFSNVILDFTVPELYEIVKKVDEILDIFHTKIVHRDVKLENMYVQRIKQNSKSKDKFKILFADWGSASFDLSLAKEDKGYFRRRLTQRLLMAYLFKKNNIKSLLKLLEDKGLKKNFIDTVNKTMKIRGKKHPYRPKEFIESHRPIIFNNMLFIALLQEYGKEFLMKKAGLSKPMSDFLESIESRKQENKDERIEDESKKLSVEGVKSPKRKMFKF
jgi:serine/threonine protein kinase